jgi:hypothetical protein
MKAFLTAVLAGLGLFAPLATGSAQTNDSGPDASRGIGGCIIKPPQDNVRVDIQGPIHQVREWHPRRTVWQITANGRTYELNLGTDKTGQLKDGTTVRVTGQLVHEIRPQLLHTLEFPPRPWPPLHVWVVMADTLEPVSDKNPPAFARATVRGTLNLKAKLGYPPQDLKIVTADGQKLVLDLGILTGLGMLKVEALDGKVIDLEGDITGFHLVTTMCVPDQDELPIVRVRKLSPVK